MADGDSLETVNDQYAPSETGELPHKLQITRIFMRLHENGKIVPWDGKPPAGRCSVFILNELDEGFIHQHINVGDLRRRTLTNQRRPLVTPAHIPTQALIGRPIGKTVIGTYLYPSSSMLDQPDSITTQEAQTLLDKLIEDGYILKRNYKDPNKYTFWFKFDKGDASNFDICNHYNLIPKCFKSYGKFIHYTLSSNISPTSKYYRPLRKYIPRDRDAVSRSIILASMGRGIGKPPSVPPLHWRGGGKSRGKLKTTNRRRNKRTTKRRNRRTTKRRNTKKRRN
jgi:hypothetical protein